MKIGASKVFGSNAIEDPISNNKNKKIERMDTRRASLF
jgi:hypothetical protein